MKKWFVYGKKADFQELGEKLSLDPVLVRILRNRDLTTEEEMRNFLEGEEIPSPLFLPDSIRFLNRLERAIRDGEKVRIVGDYDVDGVCASTILAKALSLFFSKELLSVVIPHRILDGYGINEQIIEEAKAEGISLLLTCDNGISAFSAMEKAKSYGIDVLLTDHHDLRRDEEGKKRIPEAFAVVNPKREGSKYPNQEICGAMVCYLLMKMLLEKQQKGLELLEELACFAGIATVCDVMPLQKENRVIVKYCLSHLQKCKNIGIQALLQQCNISPEQEISSYTLGFQIGPCINAGGRLESAMLALSLFLEEEEGKAREKAAHLLVLNEERKEMTKKGVDEAKALVEQEGDVPLLFLYLPDLHESLAGIVAGRIREAYYRPCFIVTNAEGDRCKASGRSIPGYPMAERLEEQKELLLHFGGHPMAAGFSVAKEKLLALKQALLKHAKLLEEDLEEKVWIDVVLPFSYLKEDFVRSLACLEPFGRGNEKPAFAQKNVLVKNFQILGKNKNAIKLYLEDEQGVRVEGMIFEDAEKFLNNKASRKNLNLLYYPRIHEYNNVKQLQLVISEYFWQEE